MSIKLVRKEEYGVFTDSRRIGFIIKEDGVWRFYWSAPVLSEDLNSIEIMKGIVEEFDKIVGKQEQQ
jgi:hypothetical protein